MADSPRDPLAVPPAPTRRADYRPPDFLVDGVELDIDLDPKATRVRSRIAFRRAPTASPDAPLRLDGDGLAPASVTLDGTPVGDNRIVLDAQGMTLADVPDDFTLAVETVIDPSANTLLSGLYTSNGSFFTQCEAEGFRRITYFPDRPDVMARYTVTLTADRARVPVLLSNGNPDGDGELPDGRHWARFVDPHPKPSYLFALVAGDLVAVRDRFETRSGRAVDLAIWVRPGDEASCGHAMRSLIASMRWDEQVFGLEYDLDVFHIAAVSDFNMGAMENKGLNVFNTRYVLARWETATDGDFQGVETVIAHEYFHNWTGNRVTCRDWFQLSLKEGLTVFRDQEFSADQGSRGVKRVQDVIRLRAAQFPEDAGPLAHPVRPDSYLAIDNFYTATVYQKGAEVVRMMHTLLGPRAFRHGMDLYFLRHDNRAVTLEDFAGAMQDASGVDLARFRAWYDQAGTPDLHAAGRHDAAARRYTLTLRQETAPTPGQPDKRPLPIPVAMALLDGAGREIAAKTLLLEDEKQDFVFNDVAEPPTPSLLRGFSAPVKLHGIDRAQLRFLAAHDRDPFVAWDSGQQYATAVLLDAVAAGGDAPPDEAPPDATPVDAGLLAILRAALANPDPAMAAQLAVLPGEHYLADQMAVADPDRIHAVREAARRGIGAALAAEFAAIYDRLDPDPDDIGGQAIGERALRNACLGYLAATGDLARAERQYAAGRNMTEVIAALAVLAHTATPARDRALADFHARWRRDDLVLDKWFAIQAMSPLPDALDQVRALTRHPDFDPRNPNRLRSLVGSFASGNPVRFHDAAGAGYRFLADRIVELDPVNGQIAARLVGPLGAWRRQNAARGALMRAALGRILETPGLSRGTFEMATRSLASAPQGE